MRDTLNPLLEQIRACRHCAASLPCGPRPVLQVHRSARLRIVGQAPGRKVHESGIPWNDASGDRLRDWLGLTPERFYDAKRVAIVPMVVPRTGAVARPLANGQVLVVGGVDATGAPVATVELYTPDP